ncbi:DUF3330 domain-containing protein [Kaarinaea lacus]
MNTKQSTDNWELVECEVCLKEIPASEAQSEEVNDYVLYFCGLECFDKWRNPEDKVEQNS